MHSLRQRLAREEGFTLIELLIVMIIIGILLAIAVPSYLGFRSRAQDAAAKSNLREAVPSAEAFFSDHSNTTGYGGMTAASLQAIDTGMSTDVTVNAVNATHYCLADVSASGKTFYFAGPGGSVTTVQTGLC